MSGPGFGSLVGTAGSAIAGSIGSQAGGVVGSAIGGLSGLLPLEQLGLNALPNPTNSLSAAYKQMFGAGAYDALWEIDGKKWGESLPYRFTVKKNGAPPPEVTGGLGDQLSQIASNIGQSFINAASSAIGIATENQQDEFYHFCLPIPPQALSLKPIMASKVTPTLGGVVEEVSPVKLWQIQLSGTMGVGVARSGNDIIARANAATQFRQTVTASGVNPALSAAIAYLDNFSNALNNVNEVLGGDLSSLANSGNEDEPGAPALAYQRSAVNQSSNGFTETHELLKFLYMYSAMKAKSPDVYELYFENHKTNQAWRVAVQDISTNKNAQNPHLERYQIALIGWDVQRHTLNTQPESTNVFELASSAIGSIAGFDVASTPVT